MNASSQNSIFCTPNEGRFSFHEEGGFISHRKKYDLQALTEDAGVLLKMLFDGTSFNEAINFITDANKIPRGGQDAAVVKSTALAFISQLEADGYLKLQSFPSLVSSRKSNLLRVQVAITSECNLRCLDCYASDAFGLNRNMSLDEISVLAEQMDILGVHKVEIVGGEPSLHPNFIDVLKIFSKYNFSICLFTNGTTIGRKLAKELFSCVSHIIIAIDGPQENHDKWTRMHWAQYRSLYGISELTRAGVPVTVGMALSPETIPYVEDVFRLAQKYGAVGFMPLPSAKTGYGKELKGMNEAGYRAAYDAMNNLMISHPKHPLLHPIRSPIGGSAPERFRATCQAGISFMYVDVTGQGYLCPLLQTTHLPSKDATHKLESAWLDVKMQRASVIGNPNNKSPCIGCHPDKCRYLCPANQIHLYGNSEPPGYCSKVKRGGFAPRELRRPIMINSSLPYDVSSIKPNDSDGLMDQGNCI